MHNQENLRTAALFYAKKGLPVFPVYEMSGKHCACGTGDCSSPAKHPRVKQGFKDATTDNALINSWWDKWPNANIGAATGGKYVVIDVDSYHGGDDGLAELCAGNDLPDTWETLTGGGGRHLWFLIPDDVCVASKVGIATGVDVRGDGGYVIMPPSVHQSGRLYDWEASSRIDEIDVAPLPDWLKPILVGDENTIIIKPPAEPLSDRIAEGSRHSRLLSIAGSWRNSGMIEAEILPALQQVNRHRCDPPLPDRDIDKLASDIASRYDPGSVPNYLTRGITKADPPTQSPPVEPYPTALWPTPIREYLERQAKALSAPVDFVGVPMVAALGTVIGTRRAAEMKPGWLEHPCIWTGIVGKSGTHKSPAHDKAVLPLRRIQQRCQADHEEALKQYEEENHEDRGDTPVRKQAYTTDVTVEALTAVLNDNPRGIAVLRDELTSLVLSMDQYRSGKGADRQFYMSTWNGAQITSNRVSRPDLVVDRPFVCISGGIPPDVLGDLADKQGRDDGFINRFLLAFPAERKVRWTDESVPEDIVSLYCKVFDDLWNLPDLPAVLLMTAKAKDCYQQWFDEHHAEMDDPVFPEHIRGVYAKMDGYCGRIALIHQLVRHVCEGAAGTHIGEESVIAAAAMVTYYKSHALMIHNRVYADKRDRRVLSAVDWLRRHGNKATGREMLTARLGSAKTMNDIHQLIGDIVDRGYGYIDHDAGRSDSTVLRLNI